MIMAEFLQKASVPVDVKTIHDKDMSCMTQSTEDFFQFNIPYCFELIPERGIKGIIKGFGRNTAMLRPMLGSAKCVYRKFWVPYRVVWPPFNTFRTGSPYTTDVGTIIINSDPLISMKDLVDCFVNPSAGFDPLTRLLDPNDTYDAGMIAADEYDLKIDTNYYVFTRKGRQAKKVLNELGYQLIPIGKQGTDFTVSALPLLCAAKVYIDWFWPSQYAQVGSAAVVEGITHRHFSYYLGQGANKPELEHILSLICYTFYENDLFTSAWDNPVAPSNGAYMSIVIPDITNSQAGHGYQLVSNDPSLVTGPSNANYKPSNGTAFVGDNIGGSQHVSSVLTQYADTSLHILTDIMHKNAIVGSRALERYLAMFGLHLQAEQLQRSVYLGQYVYPWQIGEVTSTADTVSSGSGAALGDYAGMGIAADPNKSGLSLDYFNPSEYGFFIVTHSILPDISYVQGIDPHCFHKTPYDFFDGKMELLGTAPIPVITLMSSKYSDTNWGAAADTVFGFTRRYYDQCVSRDRLVGDYSVPSVNTGLLAWSTARMFRDAITNVPSGFAHGLDFMRASVDGVQYDRCFYGYNSDPDEIDNLVDNFKFVHRISVKFADKVRPFYDSYDWMCADNPKISIKGNGVRMS